MKRWPEFRHPLFLVAVFLYVGYLANRYLVHWPMPTLLTSYLGDLAAMPVMLSLALAAQRRFVVRSRAFVLPDTWLIAAWLYVSLWFEGILPYFSARAVADPFDVVAYAVGTGLFRYWLNRPV
ncbi:hypothetical protein SAMN00120144_0157 [Hymenobacter roseosalivarius DSM 11622]|uniref:Magnesium citrate secondary transporter n=1 Tax=Hymenobacter roseosalivarius DSM 11622 TaxID=645990 RepID=A0A1W1W163_9BACT|nr:hypothetical protein [Hymenobacter roseosalivarius]SMB99369.1 hypothetical protein SAMN00120144_0157 [Hymenobacter roseosalivarius DSM 11622]